MICKPCQDGSHGLCETSRGGFDIGDGTAYSETHCDCQHRMPTDPTVDFYYAAARALDYLSMDEHYDDFRLHWAQITRQVMPHSKDDFAGMAQRARNSAVHYWQQLTGRNANELSGETAEKGDQETEEAGSSV